MTDLTSTTPTPQDDSPIPNLMDLFGDDAWLEAAVRIEEESDDEVGVRYEGIYFSQLLADPVGFHQVKRLQTIVMQEFRHLLAELNLGIGTEAACVCGQKIVLNRLAQPEIEIQQQLWAVLEEEQTVQGTDTPNPLRARVKDVLRQTLTNQDWEEIAIAASHSIRVRVLEYGTRLPQTA
jgi:hypothetical protein